MLASFSLVQSFQSNAFAVDFGRVYNTSIRQQDTLTRCFQLSDIVGWLSVIAPGLYIISTTPSKVVIGEPPANPGEPENWL